MDTTEVTWAPATIDDASVLGELNLQLAQDEGAVVLGPVAAYINRMRRWLETGRYQASLARTHNGTVVAYLLWRAEPEYDDVFIRQFLVPRAHRSQGLGQQLFEEAVQQLWPDRPLRLDVYDSNPRGGQFWERVGFVPYSRLMKRQPLTSGSTPDHEKAASSILNLRASG